MAERIRGAGYTVLQLSMGDGLGKSTGDVTVGNPDADGGMRRDAVVSLYCRCCQGETRARGWDWLFLFLPRELVWLGASCSFRVHYLTQRMRDAREC